jgi:7-carboxy-7-deazaguanine synthase
MSDPLVVNEVYLSLQGESTFAGLPCVFVRLTACNLRCSYCDTAYAFSAGNRKSTRDIHDEIRRLSTPFRASRTVPPHPLNPADSPANRPGLLPLVEFTGGEPLLQHGVLPLMTALCDEGYTVLIETSGALDVAKVDPRVRKIMDLKCPGSGETARNRWENLAHLNPTDEIKFVVGSVEDYEWVKRQIAERGLASICPLLLSWVHPLSAAQQDPSLKAVPPGHTPVTRLELAERVIADALPVRFQVQLHKILWPPEQRGV